MDINEQKNKIEMQMQELKNKAESSGGDMKRKLEKEMQKLKEKKDILFGKDEDPVEAEDKTDNTEEDDDKEDIEPENTMNEEM